MRAESDNVMESKRQSWCGNEGKEHVSAVRRKSSFVQVFISNLCPLRRAQLHLSPAFYSHGSHCGAAGERLAPSTR